MANENLDRCAQCAERAWRLAYTLMRNVHDAEDVVQESFVVAARRRDRIPTDDPWPWFATVVTNVARNARRSRRKHMHDEPRDVPAPPANTELSVLVADALAQLPEHERDALACTSLSGLTHEQAAEALGVPVGTVSTRVRGGYAKLREKLGKDDKEVALGIGIIFVPQPTGGIESSVERWVEVAGGRVSDDLAIKGEGMKTKVVVAMFAVIVVLLLTWVGVVWLEDNYNPAEQDWALTERDSNFRDARRESDASEQDGVRPAANGHAGEEQADANRRSADTATESLGGDGVLRVGVNHIDSLDPQLAEASDAGVCISMSYETLYEFDPFLLTSVRPLIASGPVRFRNDETTAIINLRSDVKFFDDPCFPGGRGRGLTADDVVFSLRRCLESEKYAVTLGRLLRGSIRPETEEEHVRNSVVALDRYTVQLELSEPCPDLAFALSRASLSIIPHEAVEYYGVKLSEHMVGTGPFKLVDRTVGSLRFMRNPDYRDVRLEDVPRNSPLKHLEGRRLPLIDEVELVLDSSGVQQLLQGGLSIASIKRDELEPLLINGKLELSEEWKAKGLKLFAQVDNTSHLVEFNMLNETIGTPGGEKARAMRRALSVGFDRKTWTESVLGHYGFASSSMIAPGVLIEDKEQGAVDGDIELARRILADAGFLLHMDGEDWVAIDPDKGDQPSLTILLRGSDTSSVRKGEEMAALGRRIGLVIEVQEPEDWPAFVRRRALEKDGKTQIFDMGWAGGASDPAGRFELYTSTHDLSLFRNERYDRLVPRLEGLRSPGSHEYREAVDALSEIIKILEDEVPVFTIAYSRRLALARADLERPSLPANYDTHFKYWSLGKTE